MKIGALYAIFSSGKAIRNQCSKDKTGRFIPDILLKQRLFEVPDEIRLAIFMSFRPDPESGVMGCFMKKPIRQKKSILYTRGYDIT